MDHVYPVKKIWEDGAWKWSDVERNVWFNNPDNLVTACPSCQSQKGASDPFDWFLNLFTGKKGTGEMIANELLLDLKRRIETFQEDKVDIFPRTEIARFDVPKHWKRWLSNPQFPIEKIIYQLWQPTSGAGRKIAELLSRRIIDIYVLSLQRGLLNLGYIFQVELSEYVNTYLESWIAGLPFIDSENINLPSSYGAFSRVHNGFLLTGNFSVGFLPVEHLRPLKTRMEQVNLPGSLEYDPETLVEFCRDGLGNIRCFDYSKPIGNGDFLTVDWDHEALQIGNPLTFWEFAEEFIAKNMK